MRIIEKLIILALVALGLNVSSMQAQVPSVNGITSAVTITGGTSTNVSTAGSTITVSNTAPLTASGLETVLQNSPFYIDPSDCTQGSQSLAESGGILYATSTSGVFNCDPNFVRYVASIANQGYSLFYMGNDAIDFNSGNLIYIGLNNSYASQTVNVQGNDATTDSNGAGTIDLFDSLGDDNIDLFGANGNAFFGGGVTVVGDVVANLYQETLYTPSSSTATCTEGQFADDANYHYVCVATNTWRRVALSSF